MVFICATNVEFNFHERYNPVFDSWRNKKLLWVQCLWASQQFASKLYSIVIFSCPIDFYFLSVKRGFINNFEEIFCFSSEKGRFINNFGEIFCFLSVKRRFINNFEEIFCFLSVKRRFINNFGEIFCFLSRKRRFINNEIPGIRNFFLPIDTYNFFEYTPVFDSLHLNFTL